MIGDDAVDESSRLLVDADGSRDIGPGDGGLDGRTVEDSQGAAIQQGLVVGTDRVGPRDSVVVVSDWPRPSWPCVAEPRSP